MERYKSNHPSDLGVHHEAFEPEVVNTLSTKYYVSTGVYHDNTNISDEFKSLLSHNISTTAIYFRTSADRISLSHDNTDALKFEFKTGHKTIKIEAYPLAAHILLSDIGVKCLYAYRDVDSKREVGFWATRRIIPSIKRIVMPRWTLTRYRHLMPHIRHVLGMQIPHEIRDTHQVGSGDIFIEIESSEWHKFPHWRELIKFDEEEQS